MEIVASGPDGDRDIDVHIGDDAVVADLAGAVFPGASGPVAIDARSVAAPTPLAETGLAAGSLLRLGDRPAGGASSGRSVVELRILSGPGAGMAVALPPGRHIVGSGPGANVALRPAGVAARHAIFDVGISAQVTVHSLVGAMPPVTVTPETTIRIGRCLVGCVPLPEPVTGGRRVPGRRGTVPFNRPPRRIAHGSSPVLQVPAEPRPPGARARMGAAAIVVPLLFGLVLAVVIHPRMALFALLGPVMMMAGWLDEKRRARRFRRTTAVESADAAARVGDELDRLRAGEVRRRVRTGASVAELAWRAAQAAPALWERRPSHPDFLRLVVGYARAWWRPPLEGDPAATTAPVRAALAARSLLPRAPTAIDLSPGRVLGVAGRRQETLDLVRGLLCQAAVLHGPADLRIAVATDRPTEWDWVKWLPHTLDEIASGRRLLASTPEEIARLAGVLTPPTGSPPSPPAVEPPAAATLLVVDGPDLAAPSLAGIRHVLGGRGVSTSGIVVAVEVDQLPSVCTAVATTTLPHVVHVGGTVDGDLDVTVAGAELVVARRCARALARFDDPERDDDGAELPDTVRLLDLLALPSPTAEAVSSRWAESSAPSSTGSSRWMAPIGLTESGPLQVDLVGDGPHGLLAGTTGSGKSELLRTLVAGLAATVGPDQLTFVLIDYKGGSAFDACSGLPHTVGVVTDLDDHLAERALTCLEAELRHREERLRSAGVDDLSMLPTDGNTEPLPRMLIVIDEFAALARELPQFMDALVDIGARGRSLGIHLLVATQRPAGVVGDNLRANTNIRIALRVQDRADSTDVVDDPRAAAIGRSQPGRGYLRLGPGEMVAFQAAIVTGAHRAGASLPVRIAPFRFAMEPEAPTGTGTDGDGPTDLERLVSAASGAAHLAEIAPPRRPWPDPLPGTVTVDQLDLTDRPRPMAVPIGLLDEPELQRLRTVWWDPDQGSLLIYGSAGSGTTTALATLAVGLANAKPPTELHMYVLDFDTGGVASLERLPHVGAVVGPGERERQVRLIRMLATEVAERRARFDGGDGSPRIGLLIDDYGAFSAAFDDPGDAVVKEATHRILVEGPGVGVFAVLTASRHNAVPAPVAAAITGRLVFRLADPLAGAGFGLRHIPADLPAGRAIQPETGRRLQVALPHEAGLEAAVAMLSDDAVTAGGPRLVEELPLVVKVPDVSGAVRLLDDEWFVPIGIGDSTLEPVGLRLGQGDHVLVAGEPRSGKSSLLSAISALLAADDPSLRIVAIAPRSSPLRDAPEVRRLVTDPEGLEEVLAETVAGSGRRLVLIDDVDDLEPSVDLTRLVASRHPDLHVIGAGHRDLKTRYQHWAKELCRSRCGVWLRPSPGVDGDLWSTPMPRRVPAGLPPGRGYLVAGGSVELMQAAQP